MTHDVERVLADVDADHGESLRCVSETWHAPCLERPLPASRTGRAGARPDHSISGHLRASTHCPRSRLDCCERERQLRVSAFRGAFWVSPSSCKDGRAAMRWCVSVGAVLVAGAIVGGDVAGIAAPSPKSRFAETKHNVPSVNVELVIAVDVSYSMDMDELAIQREGYA